MSQTTTKNVVMYGSLWCGFTQRAIAFMDKLGVPYEYVDLDSDAEAEALVASWNNGRSIRPTFDIAGEHMVNPSPHQIEAALKQHGLLE